MFKEYTKSFTYAKKGIEVAWREEANFRFHTSAALAAIMLGVLLHVSSSDWLWIVLAIGFVVSAELFNTALEELCDMLKSTHDPHIGKIKDLAAAAVLIASCAALVIGVIVFLPHLI